MAATAVITGDNNSMYVDSAGTNKVLVVECTKIAYVQLTLGCTHTPVYKKRFVHRCIKNGSAYYGTTVPTCPLDFTTTNYVRTVWYLSSLRVCVHWISYAVRRI